MLRSDLDPHRRYVRGLRLRVQGSEFRIWGSGFRVWGIGCRVQGSGFRVEGQGFRVSPEFRVNPTTPCGELSALETCTDLCPAARESERETFVATNTAAMYAPPPMPRQSTKWCMSTVYGARLRGFGFRV